MSEWASVALYFVPQLHSKQCALSEDGAAQEPAAKSKGSAFTCRKTIVRRWRSDNGALVVLIDVNNRF